VKQHIVVAARGNEHRLTVDSCSSNQCAQLPFVVEAVMLRDLSCVVRYAALLAQKHEGWVVLPTQYADGGYSGSRYT
jgi:hypothetical protein